MTTQTDRKFAELILYISDRSELDPYFGATKLNKILFFSELSFFAKHERGITDQEYVKRDFGPVPRDITTVLKQLELDKRLAIKENDFEGYRQKRPIALKKADLSLFTSEEIDIVNRVLDRLRKHTATDVSELSHQTVGWELAKFGEVIPLSTVMISTKPLTEKQEAFAKTLRANG
jgi:uncharacterized phage-associated protein